MDVTAERDAQVELDFERQHDPLTRLPNSAWLVAVLERELPVLGGSGGLALFLIDIDDFSVVNDSLGHGVGDHALRVIADRLRSAVRPDDHVGRFGGDAYLLVLHGIATPDGATRVAARIRDAVAADLALDGHHLAPSVSMGIALAREGSTAGSLLGEADAALARAKAAGRGYWRFFDESMREDALERLTLEDEIRQGLTGGQFVVHYQPIVSLVDGSVAGHEALVRWHHPTRGLLAPGAFLPVAEASGLVVGIGDAVLRTVVDTLVRRPDLPGSIAVNVSAVQLRDSQRLPDIVGAVREAGVDPRRLVLEITETAALLLGDEARLTLSRVTAAGIGLHVDDFGTGYSSVALLRDLPITGLKLDMSFVAALTGEGGRPEALTAGLAGLAAGLGLAGIAEGVETPRQAAVLRAQGWPLGQGYLFARPGPQPSVAVDWRPDGPRSPARNAADTG